MDAGIGLQPARLDLGVGFDSTGGLGCNHSL